MIFLNQFRFDRIVATSLWPTFWPNLCTLRGLSVCVSAVSRHSYSGLLLYTRSVVYLCVCLRYLGIATAAYCYTHVAWSICVCVSAQGCRQVKICGVDRHDKRGARACNEGLEAERPPTPPPVKTRRICINFGSDL